MLVEINIIETHPIKIDRTKNALQSIAKLDVDTLEKVAELACSESGKELFVNNWDAIKSMI